MFSRSKYPTACISVPINDECKCSQLLLGDALQMLWGLVQKDNGNLYSISLLWMSNSTQSTPMRVRLDSINSDYRVLVVTQSINMGELGWFLVMELQTPLKVI